MPEPGRIRTSDLGASVDGTPDARSTDRDAPDLDPHRARPDVEWSDDEAASDARRRYRSHGIEPLAPDARISPLLTPGESVVAHHPSVGLARRLRSKEVESTVPVHGHLYVTSARLVHLCPGALTIALDDIEDAALIGDRVLLVTRGGVGITLDADRPRLLRVQIAAARAARTGPTRRPPGHAAR